MHMLIFFFSSRRRHTRFDCDWSSDVCSSDLPDTEQQLLAYFSKPPVTYDSKGNIKSYGFSLLNPLRVDENGNGDFLDHYLGKATPDWQGSFGMSATVLRNFELNGVFEYKFGNYTITNLTDAFRKANPVIGRNLPVAAQEEAMLMNPSSTPAQRLQTATTLACHLKALSPYDRLNQGENGKFLRFRRSEERRVGKECRSRWSPYH